MINIIKQGNNVVITSDNPNAFNIGNGEMSVPLNTIYYVLDDESDFIQFNSTEEGEILFNGTIGNIQVNGTLVTRDNIITQLDSVFNSASGEGGAGVESVNGLTGAVLLKTINGQEITGSGDIEISGGEGTAGVSAINVGAEIQDYSQYSGTVRFYNEINDWGDGSPVMCDLRIGDENGGALWFGFLSNDNSLLLSDGGGRLNLQINEWTGTQAQYDALGTYDSGCTYNIIKG